VGENRDDAFVTFVAARGDHYLRLAVALSGDKNAGEDLFQATLERMLRRLRRAEVVRDMDAYLRQALTHAAIDRARGRNRRPEVLMYHVPDEPAQLDFTDVGAGQEWVLELLGALPARQRAVVCLRVLEDLGVTESARCLDISEGTVKSHLSRGLSQLRDALTAERHARHE
jgi:RNA polymerase sigma factor (sigma-70 family)